MLTPRPTRALVFALAVPAALVACRAQPASRMSYEDGAWAPPRRLGGGVALAAAGARSAAPESGAWFASFATARAGTTFLVGMDVRSFGPAPMPQSPLTAWMLGPEGARSLGRPSGRFRFAYPQALVDSRDRLHVVWGEPPGGAGPILANEWPSEKVASLWTAAYDQARGWSAPRPVFPEQDHELELRWNNGTVPAQGGKSPGRWALAVPVQQLGRVNSGPVPYRPQDNGIVLLGFDGTDELVASVVRLLPEAALLLDAAEGGAAGGMASAGAPGEPVAYGRATYSAVTSVGDDVFLGFIAPAPIKRGESDQNSVWLQASRDGGRMWQPPVLVSRSGRFPAHGLRTLVAPDGALHLVWRQQREVGDPVHRHIASMDGGRTWSAPDDLEAPPEAAYLEAAVDTCGAVHLIWVHLDSTADKAHIDYAIWRGGWSAVQHLFPALVVNEPTLHRAFDGRLLMAFQARSAALAPDDPTLLSTYYSELRPTSCAATNP